MAQGSFACPVDGATLQPMERQGIEIDFCPSCRGVWLDRGELDKIIERTNAAAPPSSQPEPRYEDPYRGGHQGHGHYKHKRRKSFFEELFD